MPIRMKIKSWRGMDAECMTNISQRVGFKVEFIDSSNDNNFLNNLNAGKYDVVNWMRLKSVTVKMNSFLVIIFRNYLLQACWLEKDDDRWDYGNIEQILKCGLVIRNYANSVDFKLGVKAVKLRQRLKNMLDFDEMALALKNNEIDAWIK